MDTFIANLQVPYISQFDPQIVDQVDACGPVCVTMVLNFYKNVVTEQTIFSQTGAKTGQPITALQLMNALEAQGVIYDYKVDLTPSDLQNYLQQGIPLITLVHAGDLTSREDQQFTGGHWEVVCGYRSDGYTVNDPDFYGDIRSQGDHHFYTKAEFEKSWSDCIQDGNPNNSALIIYPPASSTNIYDGIDLNNEASVKVAVDTWLAVEQGKYIDSTTINNNLFAICQAVGISNTTDIVTITNAILEIRNNTNKTVSVVTPETSTIPAQTSNQDSQVPEAEVLTSGPSIQPKQTIWEETKSLISHIIQTVFYKDK